MKKILYNDLYYNIEHNLIVIYKMDHTINYRHEIEAPLTPEIKKKLMELKKAYEAKLMTRAGDIADEILLLIRQGAY